MTAPLGIVVAAEDESDARRIKSLIDKVLIAEIAWLGEQPELLGCLREWRSHDGAATFLDIHGIHELADARRLPSPHGYFDGRPAAQDYRSAVRAMWLLKADRLPSALVWVRDTDGETSRITGWTDACTQAGEDFSVLVGGFPHECMEAWLLVALTVDRRSSEFQKLRQKLGFDPLAHPERLSHKKRVPKSAKGVCEALEVGEETWLDADLNDLDQRGAGCGLTEFMAALRDKLVPAANRGH